MPQLMTAADVADVLNVTRRSVYRYVDEDRLHATRPGNGRTLRFSPADVAAFAGLPVDTFTDNN